MLKLCEDIDTLAMMMLDSELAAQEQRDVELHVLDCAACKAHVERERAALELRRRRLAAPPAPALLRARIQRSLDEADRARRPSARRYLLPAAASFAAVAALALFAVGLPGPAKKSAPPPVATVLKEIPNDHREQVGGAAIEGATPSDLLFRLAGRETLSRGTVVLHYAAELPGGRRYDLQALVMSAEEAELPMAQRQMVGGYEVWERSGIAASVIVRDGQRLIRLGSRTLSTGVLVSIVGGTPLIARLGEDLTRF